MKQKKKINKRKVQNYNKCKFNEQWEKELFIANTSGKLLCGL